MEKRYPYEKIEMHQEERIAQAKKRVDSNCIGTALYIAGETPFQRGIQPFHAMHFIKDLVPIKEPVKGAIVSWEIKGKENEVVHMGVVTDPQRRLITHRPGDKSALRLDESIDAVNLDYFDAKSSQRATISNTSGQKGNVIKFYLTSPQSEWQGHATANDSLLYRLNVAFQNDRKSSLNGYTSTSNLFRAIDEKSVPGLGVWQDAKRVFIKPYKVGEKLVLPNGKEVTHYSFLRVGDRVLDPQFAEALPAMRHNEKIFTNQAVHLEEFGFSDQETKRMQRWIYRSEN